MIAPQWGPFFIYLFKLHYYNLHYLCSPGSGQPGGRMWEVGGNAKLFGARRSCGFICGAILHWQNDISGMNPSRVSFSLSSGHSLPIRNSTDVFFLFINTPGNLKLLKEGTWRFLFCFVKSLQTRLSRASSSKEAIFIHFSNSFN